MTKHNDTGLHTLMNFMRENKGLFYYDEPSKSFILMKNNQCTVGEMDRDYAQYGSFGVPNPDDDIETYYIKPIITTLKRCRDGV